MTKGADHATLDRELFQASGYAPDEAGVDWAALPPLVRVLLSTDGTVTKSLESYFWEPVQVTLVSQGAATPLCESRVLDSAQHHTEQSFMQLLNDAEGVWRRDVRLVGQHSERHFVTASSLIRFELLPVSLRLGLDSGALGIGGVIRELGLETYRKVVAVGQCPASGEGYRHRDVWRVYRLYYQGEVLMQIRELFHLSPLQA
ncbi:MAG TPA: chorismate pyruvate-lyase family protein [Marinagarivorans sp.]